MLRSIAGSLSVIRTRLVLLFALLALLGFFSFSGRYLGTETTSARPCHEVEHFYYDDQWHTNQVGYLWLTCSGNYSWGYPTQYDLVVDGEPCCWNCPNWC